MGRTAKGVAVLTVAILMVIGCGPPPAPPGPGEARGALPDLRGVGVMVFPVQLQTAVPQGVTADAELAHALRTRGEGVAWVFSPEMEEILARSPSVSAQLRDLPVRIFLQAEVNRIGDPLFGNLIRLGGLTGADVALIPIELRYQESGRYQLGAALIGVRDARVLWYGVVEGRAGEAGDPGALASVAETLARTILPFG